VPLVCCKGTGPVALWAECYPALQWCGRFWRKGRICEHLGYVLDGVVWYETMECYVNAGWVLCGAMCMHLYDTVETGNTQTNSQRMSAGTGLRASCRGPAAGGTRVGNDVARGNAGCEGKGWRIAS
jgi:hypothetical protein